MHSWHLYKVFWFVSIWQTSFPIIIINLNILLTFVFMYVLKENVTSYLWNSLVTSLLDIFIFSWWRQKIFISGTAAGTNAILHHHTQNFPQIWKAERCFASNYVHDSGQNNLANPNWPFDQNITTKKKICNIYVVVSNLVDK